MAATHYPIEILTHEVLSVGHNNCIRNASGQVDFILRRVTAVDVSIVILDRQLIRVHLAR